MTDGRTWWKAKILPYKHTIAPYGTDNRSKKVFLLYMNTRRCGKLDYKNLEILEKLCLNELKTS